MTNKAKIKGRGAKVSTWKPGQAKRGPKEAPINRLMFGTIEERTTPIPEFNRDKFIEHCKEGMKLTDLMNTHGLSLYQVRELRKGLDLKTR